MTALFIWTIGDLFSALVGIGVIIWLIVSAINESVDKWRKK